MNKLTVLNQDGQLLVESREVAEMTSVRHGDLLEKINNYIKHLTNGKVRSLDFFIPSTYEDGKGEARPCFLLTRKGCDMVANKMTGEKGVLFTAAYVTQFEHMEKQLSTPQLSGAELIAAIANQAVEQEKRMKTLESKVDVITNGMTAVPEHAVIVTKVNEYSRWSRIGQNEVYSRIYDIMQAKHGIDIRQRVNNERKKVDDEYFERTGKRYAESTLKSKVNGIDIMVRMGVLDKFHEILIGLMASEIERSMPIE